MSVQPHEVSPNIGNYYVGRGFCEIKLPTDAGFVDCGNVTEFTFQVKPTLLDHYSSRVGVRTKDLVVVTQLEATLNLSMEEITARNMGFAVLGDFVDSPGGTFVVDIFSTPLIFAAFRFTGTNVVGAQLTALFPNVLITPSKAMSLISAGSGSWGTLDFQADVLKDEVSGKFGTLTSTDIESP